MSAIIKYDMPEEEYHKSPGISSSAMKRALISAAHYKAYIDGEEEPTPAMELGTAVHGAILQQDYSKYIQSPDCRRGTKEWTAFEEANPGKILLKPDDFQTVEKMFKAFYGHSIAAKLISKGKAEVSIFTECKETGLAIRGRIDYLVIDGTKGYILDYKSTTSAQTAAFANQIFDYRYDLSMAHYKALVQEAFGITVEDVFFIPQEKKEPFQLRTLRATDRMMEQGLNDRNKALYIIKQAMDKGVYEGYSEKIEEIDMLDWQYRKLIDA